MTRRLKPDERLDYKEKKGYFHLIVCPECSTTVAVKNGYHERLDLLDDGKWKKHAHQPKAIFFADSITNMIKVGLGSSKMTYRDFIS